MSLLLQQYRRILLRLFAKTRAQDSDVYKLRSDLLSAAPSTYAVILNNFFDKYSLSASLKALQKLEQLDKQLHLSLLPHANGISDPAIKLYLECDYKLSQAYYLLSNEDRRKLLETKVSCRRALSKTVVRRKIATLLFTRGNLSTEFDDMRAIGVDIAFLPQAALHSYLKRIATKNDYSLLHTTKNALTKEVSFSIGLMIKINFLEATLNHAPNDSYKKFEYDLIHLPNEFGRQFTELKLSFDKIPSDKFFLDIATNAHKKETFRALLREHIVLQKPFSYVRVNDGECYGFPEQECITVAAIERQERHWWGTHLNPELRSKIQSEFKGALQDINAIGIPGFYKFIGDIPANDDYNGSIASSELLVRGFGTAKAVLAGLTGNEMVLDAQSNLFLFDMPYLNELIALSNRTIIISGFSSDKLCGLFNNNPKISYIELPTHNNLKFRNFSSKSPGILPDTYESIMAEINSLCVPGTLCLFSAGFIGKIMIQSAAKHGAVSLDIGQFFLKLLETD